MTSRVASYVRGLTGRGRFSDLKAFCIFIGSGRSGHSLIGSLLDAHPNMVVSHQLDVLGLVEDGFDRWQVYDLVTRNSRREARRGRQETGYSYVVPNSRQGSADRLEVIGDKAGLASLNVLRRTPDAIVALADATGLPVKVIHAVRNPYDNVATIAKRNLVSLDTAVRNYFWRCDTAAAVVARPEHDVLQVHHEDFIADPTGELREICLFLGVDPAPDYLRDCASIVRDRPHLSRNDVVWPATLREQVARRIERYDFLSGYSFET